jgi:signal transduction histidine kinase/CheY-like chemotaxis protein
VNLPITSKAAAILSNFPAAEGQEAAATEQLFLKAAIALSAAQRETVFKDLAHSLVELLEVDVAMISVLRTDSTPPIMDAIALWMDGNWIKDFRYPLAETPCATVIGGEFRYYPEALQAQFASAEVHKARLAGYAGFPLTGSAGEALGVVAVMTHAPMQHPERVEALLRLFSDRVVVEIERARSEAARKAAEDERLALEAQLRHAQRMETVGQLTGGIAHDFNNILTGLLGYVEMAKEQVDPGAHPKLARYLDRAHRSGQRARNLVQQMLTFSRGQRGQPRPVEIAQVTRDMMSLLESTLPSSIELERRIPEHLPMTVLDPLHFEQVLLNLCINSRDAMEGVGKLTVEVRQRECVDCVCCASCRMPIDGPFVELAIADTGPGIPAEVRDRMFEPFFSTKESGKGTGMGLAIVHSLVHEYGGHLIVDTVLGKGTRIGVLLPCDPHPEAQPATGSTAPKGLAEAARFSGHVLCVDDNPEVGEFMEELLQGWGLEVTRFEDSEAAMADFARDPGRFDFAIVDQTMPRLTGIDLARQMLTLRPVFPILLYTGYSDQINEESVKAAGVRALLKKPMDLGLLRRQVADLLHCRGATIQ